MSKTLKTTRLEVTQLPELGTQVGVSGSTQRQEVGGTLCLSIAAGIAIYVAR